MAAVSHQLLAPDVLSAMANLELVARCVVDGAMVGLHRSPRFGFSQEFAEYRAYVEGDDPRYIDWNVLARSGRTYVKQFQGETNAHLMILLDASASMGWTDQQVSKFRYGQMLAASLAFLARRQHDAVGLMIFADQVRQFRAPTARAGALTSVLALIEAAQPAAGTSYEQPLQQFSSLIRRRGVVAMISDFYCDPQTMIDAVAPITLAGHDGVFFHLLDRTEMAPAFNGPRLMEDAETGQAMEVSRAFLQDEYPARIQAHIEAIRSAVRGSGAHYVLCPTDQPLTQVLRSYLLARGRRQ